MECENCGGSGEIELEDEEWEDCPECDGTGEIDDDEELEDLNA